MASRPKFNRSRHGLLALVVVALLLLFLATIVGGPHKGLQCAPLEFTSAAESPVESERPLLDTAPRDQTVAAVEQGAEVALASKPNDRAPVRGFVRDAAVSDQVPFVTVEVRAGQERERVQADFGGFFTSKAEFASGKLQIEVFDGETSYGVTELDWSPELMGIPTTITIDIGPTVTVHNIGSRLVDPDDAWLLRLVQTPRPSYSAGEIAVRGQELSIAFGPDIVWSEVPLRFVGKSAFARWSKVEFERMPEFNPRVEVRSARRCERGADGISQAAGLQNLGDVQTRNMLVLSGNVDAPDKLRPGPVRVLVRPDADKPSKHITSVPDFREVQTTQGRYEVEVEAGQRYSVLAWRAEAEPTLLARRVEENCRYQVDRGRLDKLLYPSFDPSVVPPEIEIAVKKGSQIVRARAAGTGNYALTIVDMWEAFEGKRRGAVTETRYEIELIGLDCEPATLGRPWKQILPGKLVPDRLPSDLVVRPHRIEWIDPRFETARTDAYVTGDPGGPIVSLREMTLAKTWNVDAKCPLRFTVWKDGCEPVAVRSEDFVERGDENVANVELSTGWGVALAFVVVDSEVKGSDGPEREPASRGSGPRRTFSSMFDFLSYPPLPGVAVTSLQVRGETDAHGWVLLRASTWPDRLTVRAPGYRLRDLRRLPGGGARWIAYMEHDRYDP